MSFLALICVFVYAQLMLCVELTKIRYIVRWLFFLSPRKSIDENLFQPKKKNSRAQERKKFTKILVVVDQTAHSLCCSVFIILLCGFVLLCFFFACFISASYCLPLSCTTYICSFIVFFFFFFPATYTASISQCCFSLLLFFVHIDSGVSIYSKSVQERAQERYV